MKRIIITLILISIIAPIIYYFLDGGKTINANISSNTLSAQDLICEAKPYVNSYWRNKKYFVGEIFMKLDSNLEGEVIIWYKDDIKDRNGVPNIITLDIDTKKKKIISITKQERNTKIEPGKINIENWAVDSDEAVEIAKQAFKDTEDFDFTKVFLNANNLYGDAIETWDLSFYNEKNNKAYVLKIDAYSGEIYKKKVK